LFWLIRGSFYGWRDQPVCWLSSYAKYAPAKGKTPSERFRKDGKMAAPRDLLFRFNSRRTAIAAFGCCLVCALLMAAPVHALDPNKRLTQYMHTSWRIQDGSAPADMFSVVQTSDGFLWLTSGSQGMYRFDGIRFVPWTLTVDGRTIDHVVSVHSDHTGGLWAVGEHEVFHLKGGVVTSHFALEGQHRTGNISEDPDGSLWMLLAGFNLHAPLCHITDHEVKCLGESDGIRLPPTGGEALLADGKGGFWLGGQKAVVHWHGGVSEVFPIEALKTNSGDGVSALTLDSNGSLWIGLLPQGPGEGLGRLEKGVFKSFVAPGFDGSKLNVIAQTLDRDGSLWVGTLGNGLFRTRGDVVEHYGRAEGLSSDYVNDLFEDREGILWATTSNGIDSFRDPRVATFSTSEGLGSESAVGVLASRDGTVWVANGDSLVKIKNGTVTPIRGGHGLPSDQVSYMLEDRAGNLWIGVYPGLYVFKNGYFRRISEPDHQPLGLILGMAEDVDGNIWAVCSGVSRKLIRIRDFQVREQFPTSQVPMGLIAPDPHGGIWIGPRIRNGTLVLFRDGIQKEFPTGAGANLRTNHLIVRADGSVMAAFDDGLVGLRHGKAQRMTTKNGLPCNAVYSFIEDKHKGWWLLTECGIVEFPDSELQRWWANPEAVVQTRLYDAQDGARPGRYGIRSADVSPDGRVWFATGFVLQMVDPSRLSQKALPAQTYIESVIVDRKEFEAKDNLKLSAHPRDVQIDYTSPTFTIPQKVKFRYRLEGYDRDWKDAGTRRQAFYTDLPPGKYSFRVIASNSDGVWNDSAAKLDFYVTPAYYQTNWFRVLSACIFLALLWAAYQWRVRQLHHQFDLTLEARVGERTRIARDLHDTLLQSAHGVLLRFQTVSQLLPDRPVEAKEKLDNAIDQTADFITEARDEVQGLRDSTVQSNDLALAISTLGQELGTDSAQHRPAFRVAVEGEVRNLHPILRDETCKIAAEALRNAFRHSQARQIEVEIRYDTEQFRLRVRDDGKGIDPAILSSQSGEGHFGLPGMRERATLIGGKLVVWSEFDAGTEVELRVPASAAYLTEQRSSWFSRKAKA
jgi:signal transduction histidine kinase/ligand-binding sensor domain-containing protein